MCTNAPCFAVCACVLLCLCVDECVCLCVWLCDFGSYHALVSESKCECDCFFVFSAPVCVCVCVCACVCVCVCVCVLVLVRVRFSLYFIGIEVGNLHMPVPGATCMLYSLFSFVCVYIQVRYGEFRVQLVGFSVFFLGFVFCVSL